MSPKLASANCWDNCVVNSSAMCSRVPISLSFGYSSVSSMLASTILIYTTFPYMNGRIGPGHKTNDSARAAATTIQNPRRPRTRARNGVLTSSSIMVIVWITLHIQFATMWTYACHLTHQP
jgi:hypothetical protein